MDNDVTLSRRPDKADMGVKPGELSWVHGLAIDPQGNLYLGDIMGQWPHSLHEQEALGALK